MNERYTRIFEGTPDLYADGAPVIIKANVLLKDNTDGRVIAQLKYQNVSEKAVTFIKVALTTYDALNSEIGLSESFEYSDLSAGQYEEFGSKNPLVLRERNARSYSVRVVGAAFADGSIWNDEGKEWRQDTEKAKDIDNDIVYRRAKSLFESASTENEFNTAAALFQENSEFKDSDALAKQCAEKAEVCRKDAIYSSARTEQIKNSIAGCESAIKLFESISGWKDADEQTTACQRKIEEIKAKEEADRLERERQAEQRRKKRKKIAAIVTPIVVACIAFIIVIIPNGKYNSALDLYNAGKYDEAITAFKALNGYRDSEDQIINCKTAIKDSKYNAALDLYNAGKYDEAITAFKALNGYRDSKYQIINCETAINDSKYNAAVDLYNAGKYDEAITAFKALNGYKGSETQITKCETAINDLKYNSALDLYNAGKYEDAHEAFNSLNYKDSAEKAAECLFLKQKSGLTNVKAGFTIRFGFYEQDNDTSNGKEEIEWKVLAVEGNKALVISRYALDSKRYNSNKKDVTWEKCTLRTWLNETFYNSAFGADYQKMIASSTVTADKNPSYSTSPGNNTTDKVFLLSINEANKYFSSDSARQCKGTAYCYAKGALKSHNGYCAWWLRSPGYYSDFAARVHSDGSVDIVGSYVDGGYNVDNSGDPVRPAMWISLD